MSKDSGLEQGIKILKWAIDNNKTLTDAQKQFGVSERFLRGIRERLNKNNVKSKQSAEFMKLYGEATGTRNIDNQFDSDLKSGQKKFTEEGGGLASFEYKGSKMITSLEQAIKFFKIDTKIWEVERYVCNSYPVSAREREQDLSWNQGVMTGYAKRANKWTTTVNYQVKLWLKKKVDIVNAIKFDDFFKELLSKHKPTKYSAASYPKERERNLLEINICDLHLGKLCWGGEVGNDYDMKIASKRFNHALHDLVVRAGKNSFDKILFIVGNDFFNSDTHIGTTTEGTRQDEDSRWQKTFARGVELVVEGIDYLRQFAAVDIMIIPGNHDTQKSIYLGHTLSAWYRNDKNVKVDASASVRKYYLYGNSLLGFTHGDKEHTGALRMLMPLEVPKLWAKSKYREFHCGHWHRDVSYIETVKAKKNDGAKIAKVPLTDEQLGIVIRHLRSLAGTDAWHYGKGYVGPIKGATAFLWSFNMGLLAFYNSNIKK